MEFRRRRRRRFWVPRCRAPALAISPAAPARRALDRGAPTVSSRACLLTARSAAKFDGLKTASQRAIQYLDESCPKNDPATPTVRVEALEQRLSAMLEAVRTVQPALDDFYATLTDEQKARLAALAPSGDSGDSSTYRDRRGQRRARGRHFRFRPPLPVSL